VQREGRKTTVQDRVMFGTNETDKQMYEHILFGARR